MVCEIREVWEADLLFLQFAVTLWKRKCKETDAGVPWPLVSLSWFLLCFGQSGSNKLILRFAVIGSCCFKGMCFTDLWIVSFLPSFQSCHLPQRCFGCFIYFYSQKCKDLGLLEIKHKVWLNVYIFYFLKSDLVFDFHNPSAFATLTKISRKVLGSCCLLKSDPLCLRSHLQNQWPAQKVGPVNCYWSTRTVEKPDNKEVIVIKEVP